MQRAESPRGKRWEALFFLTALAVTVADQLSKIWIRSNLASGASLPERGLFQFTHVHNTGAAFGLLPGQSFLLTIVAAVAIVLILLFALFFPQRLPFLDNKVGKLALGLVFGGTSGNLIDRLRLGYVTDFIDVGIWPAFNLADASIVVGGILSAFSLLAFARAQQH